MLSIFQIFYPDCLLKELQLSFAGERESADGKLGKAARTGRARRRKICSLSLIKLSLGRQCSRPVRWSCLLCEVLVGCDPARLDRVRHDTLLTANSAQLDFMIFFTWDEVLFCSVWCHKAGWELQEDDTANFWSTLLRWICHLNESFGTVQKCKAWAKYIKWLAFLHLATAPLNLMGFSLFRICRILFLIESWNYWVFDKSVRQGDRIKAFSRLLPATVKSCTTQSLRNYARQIQQQNHKNGKNALNDFICIYELYFSPENYFIVFHPSLDWTYVEPATAAELFCRTSQDWVENVAFNISVSK